MAPDSKRAGTPLASSGQGCGGQTLILARYVQTEDWVCPLSTLGLPLQTIGLKRFQAPRGFSFLGPNLAWYLARPLAAFPRASTGFSSSSIVLGS